MYFEDEDKDFIFVFWKWKFIEYFIFIDDKDMFINCLVDENKCDDGFV